MSNLYSLLNEIKEPRALQILEAELIQMTSPEGLRSKILFSKKKYPMEKRDYLFLIHQLFLAKYNGLDIPILNEWYNHCNVTDLIQFKKSISISKFLELENWEIFLEDKKVCTFKYAYQQGIFDIQEKDEFCLEKMSDYELVVKVDREKINIEKIINEMSQPSPRKIISHFFQKMLDKKYNYNKKIKSKYLKMINRELRKNKKIALHLIKDFDLDNFEKTLILYSDFYNNFNRSEDRMKKMTEKIYLDLNVDELFKKRMESISKVSIYNID